MNLKEALKRIEELERRVKELESAPKQEWHYHYHTPPAQPLPYQPQPYPWWTAPVWCGDQPATWGAAQPPMLSPGWQYTPNDVGGYDVVPHA